MTDVDEIIERLAEYDLVLAYPTSAGNPPSTPLFGAEDCRVLVCEIERLWEDAERLTAALLKIEDNALAWHGDDAAKGRALAVIAREARAALAAHERIGKEGDDADA